ncbi:MAG: hypothetical protein DDT30_00474 [Dehalococcoidia bacterium]|nr:hypothetical protein [Bacillota bacterium]MBT9139902.1 hypothetical protein [Bacillota bacterium]
MTREERFEIIAISCKESLVPLAEEVRKSLEVKVIKQNVALVMMQAVDSVEREIFNLGEVLVSEAWVEVNGELGYSQVLGDDIEKALAGAILDVVCEIKHPLREKVIKTLNREKIYYEKAKAKEYARIKSTRVEFEAMAKR